MSQCSTAGGDCNLQLENGILKCKTHDNKEIVGKTYYTELGTSNLNDTANKIYNPDSGLREPAYLSDPTYGDKSENNSIGLTLSEMQENYKNMATSVAKYGGFYVGRYETSLSDSNKNSAGTNGVAQSKQGVIPISTGDTMIWYGLYKIQNKTYTGINDSVESSMIWGSQYDRILIWAKNGDDKDRIMDTSSGNYSGKITITGDNTYKNDKINNIRDLGGNLREWTLEAFDTNFRVFRGGVYSYNFSASYQHGNYPNYTYNYYGSRMTLYIK